MKDNIKILSIVFVSIIVFVSGLMALTSTEATRPVKSKIPEQFITNNSK